MPEQGTQEKQIFNAARWEARGLRNPPADPGAVRPWTRADWQHAQATTTVRLRQLAKQAYLDSPGNAFPSPQLASTCPSGAEGAGPSGIKDFYAGLAVLGGVSPARARQQVRGVFAALIDSGGADGIEQVVGQLHDRVAHCAGRSGVDDEFLAKVCHYGRFSTTEEAARVTRATLTLLAARIRANDIEQRDEQQS